MQYNTLLTRIAADIYSNGAELITGDILQNVLNDMVGALASAGACYKGTITPASAAPLDLDQPTVYLALTAGTYTNFVDSNNDPIVTTGPALITYDGGPSLVFTKTDLPSGSPDAVLYTPQTLTDPQKTQARENIEAAHAVRITSADLSSKPYLYILIPYDSQELNLRIDVVAHNSSGDKIGYTGSLLLALNDDGGGVWTGKQAYYYGDDLALLFSSIAIDVFGDYFLVLACESSNDDITLTIYPTTDTEIAATWYASRPGTEEDTITPTVIGAGGGSSDVFWATYGTTTASEILSAISTSKLPVCKYADVIYVYAFDDTNYIYFTCSFQQYAKYLRLSKGNNAWFSSQLSLEQTANKASSISGNETSVTKYPNTKAVADALGKWGVISQTLTWNSGDNSYSVSDIVKGLIPQMFIDLVTKAGATFDTATGYFALNGITNIAYDEMKEIYDHRTGYGTNSVFAIFGSAYKARTNFPVCWGYELSYINHAPTTFYSKYLGIYNASITKFALTDNVAAMCIRSDSYNNFDSKGTGNPENIRSRLEEITGIINVQNLSGGSFFYPGAWHPWLKTFYLMKVASNQNLSGMPALLPATVAYMINNVNTQTITITLHATAYARANADADVQAALSAHTNVSLASA